MAADQERFLQLLNSLLSTSNDVRTQAEVILIEIKHPVFMCDSPIVRCGVCLCLKSVGTGATMSSTRMAVFL